MQNPSKYVLLALGNRARAGMWKGEEIFLQLFFFFFCHKIASDLHHILGQESKVSSRSYGRLGIRSERSEGGRVGGHSSRA